MLDSEQLKRGAEAIAEAEAIVITAGAGMGVDSGLPDFRGNEGFWNAYPPYRHLGKSFMEMANPHWFSKDPSYAWGFYGHRRNLYRATKPHEGFSILLAWASSKPLSYFVFTSNVDTHFHKAGFDGDRIVECHGSIEWDQCFEDCSSHIFPAAPEPVIIDESTMQARPPLPSCPHCKGLSRPNILMFGDFGWLSHREHEQYSRLEEWLRAVKGKKMAVIECGAGISIPTVRHFSESLLDRAESTTLIRINVRDPQAPYGQVSLPGGALASLQELDTLIKA
ncbi:MAG: Sir2 family NAD-dependent protein deacetylase [Candidatus Eremiobacteraeota bacterium]|nr:Sir2 family NAD-dependent protein deacetylase [Candidatus Eremiobacteraeota bacterium]